MNKKKYFKLSLFSILLCFSLTPFGGYGGHHIKFFVASLIYCGLTLYYLNNSNTKRIKLIFLLILIIPPALLYFPVHILHFQQTRVALFGTIGHFFGLFLGFLIHCSKKSLKPILSIVFLICLIWITFFGFTFWLNKVNYGTFTGKVKYDMPCTIEGKNQFGKLFSIQDFQNKILILDFWHTRCGVCFRKFPIVQELYTKYKSDTSILILTINKPIEDDSTGQAFNVIKQNGYTFPVLLPKNKSLPEIFEVTSYPTTFVIDKNGKIIFKGDIELVEPILHDLKNL